MDELLEKLIDISRASGYVREVILLKADLDRVMYRVVRLSNFFSLLGMRTPRCIVNFAEKVSRDLNGKIDGYMNAAKEILVRTGVSTERDFEILCRE